MAARAAAAPGGTAAVSVRARVPARSDIRRARPHGPAGAPGLSSDAPKSGFCARDHGHERRRQAGPPALPGRLPDVAAAAGDGRRDPRGGGGLRRHDRAGVPAPVLRRPRRDRGDGPAPGRGAPGRRPLPGRPLRAAARELLPARARLRPGRAVGPADLPLPARGAVRLRRAAAPGAPAPHPRPAEPARRPRGAHRLGQPARAATTRPRSRPTSPRSSRRSAAARRSASPTTRSVATSAPSARSTRTACSTRRATGTWSATPTSAATPASSACRASRGASPSRRAPSTTSRAPQDFDLSRYRDRAPWQLEGAEQTATIALTPTIAWWVEQMFGAYGTTADRRRRRRASTPPPTTTGASWWRGSSASAPRPR